MAKIINNAQVIKNADFAYTIESGDLEGKGEKRRGFIVENDGITHIIPFKKYTEATKKSHNVRETKNGTLSLSPARQKITLRISFDREQDSVESFTREFHELVDNYIMDVIKFEIKECLE